MKKTLIAGNWKMNLTIHEGSLLVHRITDNIKSSRTVEVVIAPTMLSLQPLALQIDHRKLKLAAQNAFYADSGQYTGEVSMAFLHGLVDYVIVGHSDRRNKFTESMGDITKKLAAAYRHNITPILCVGETAQEKLDHETSQVIRDQIITAISSLTSSEVSELVIAYEPVWALSNGRDYTSHDLPTPKLINDVLRQIRTIIAYQYGDDVATAVRLLYGGSTNSSNAADILSIGNVDGLLVGGASLNYKEFSSIIHTAQQVVARRKDKSNRGQDHES